MKRSTPLRRKTPLRARSRKNSYRRRERDLEYMRKVRKLPCIVRNWQLELEAADQPPMPFTSCWGHVQADHMGQRGLGKKAPDNTCVGICRRHHQERTDYTGTFKNWKGAEMREWCDWAIRVTQPVVNSL